ncbi:uncharacterized protein DUF5051 [Paraburkholderia sp. BL27I4N3]|uniref:3'-5' exoribonuclease n=1 Tax=Paraburkholderia sp. BL27I4N3 TaxID=1938805 RepID=UPI000E28671C|nr:3'-5' exoribonuclease [Paraburkholderia sp. BL27I4N3]REE20727.1 uncharacterized protein DUF5051 [Paraburkholderia sp. BL27I4N3]
MLLFLDTEYTGLKQLPPKLISLALVSEDGQREFYVELSDTWQMDDCSEFVRREVVPLLQGEALGSSEARAKLIRWLADAPREVQVACDSARDFGFLLEMLGDARPRNLRLSYYDLRPLIDSNVYHQAVMRYYEDDRREHHALVDARAYRKGWLAWMDKLKASRSR